MKNKIYFESITEEWLAARQITSKKSTYYRYKYILNEYLFPAFKNAQIDDLYKFDYNSYVVELSENLIASTTRNIITILKSILRYINLKYDTHIHYELIAMPRQEVEEVKVLSTKEKNKLEKYCKEDNSLRAIGIIMCLNTGLRIGEICALKWEDIDLSKKVIKVRRTLQRVYDNTKKASYIIQDNPKSKRSYREIPISSKLFNILKPMKKEYTNDSYFLTGVVTKPIEPRNYQYMFSKCLKKCGLPNYHFHQLRHTFATNCINAGMDAKSLSVILGHSNVKITLDKYVHSSIKEQRKYLEKI